MIVFCVQLVQLIKIKDRTFDGAAAESTRFVFSNLHSEMSAQRIVDRLFNYFFPILCAVDIYCLPDGFSSYNFGFMTEKQNYF